MKSTRMLGAGLMLLTFFVPSLEAADTLYKCEATYQNQPCDQAEKGSALKNLPEVSKLSSRQILPTTDAASSDKDSAVEGDQNEESPRARLPFPDENVNKQSQSLESRFRSLERRSMELKRKTRNPSNEVGRAMYYDANRLLVDSFAICTPDLFSKSMGYKDRCQDVKKALAQVASATKGF